MLSETQGQAPLYLVVMRLDPLFGCHHHSGKVGRGGASLGVITCLAIAVRQEAFTQLQ